MKKRNNAFDLLCGICIVRMVMNHITGACGFASADWWVPVMDWSYFFMSFFFFKAGYFNKTVDGNSKEFCKKKFKQLMIPYMVWGAIGSAIFFFFVWFILDPKNTVVKQLQWQHIWETSMFYGNPPCWFLFSFFLAYIFAHLISKLPPLLRIPIPKAMQWHHHKAVVNVKAHWLILVFPWISWWLWSKGNPLWLSMSNVFIGIYLFYLGRLWHFAMEKMGRKVTVALSLVMVAVFVWLNWRYGGKYTMSENRWEGDALIIITNITLSLCGLSGLLLSVKMPRIPVVNFIGEHSMVFFVAHYPIINFYKLVRSANVKSLRGNWDDFTILTVVIFVICFLLVAYVEKVPWLSGRFRSKSEVKS